MKDLRGQALQYLEQDPLTNVGIIQVIQRGTADFLNVTAEGVLLQDQISKAYMLSTAHKELARMWMKDVSECGLLQVCQGENVDFFMEKYGLTTKLDCYQMVYTKKEFLSLEGELEIAEPTDTEMTLIRQVYDKLTDEELAQIRQLHHLYVGHKEGIPVGFIGSHLEGSIGLLEILPEYRRKGYGSELEKFMFNKFLEWGLTPYGQVEEWNEKSYQLQQKMGLEVAPNRVYWIF